MTKLSTSTNLPVRVAVVVGGTGILGMAIANEFLRAGMKVAIIGVHDESIHQANDVLSEFKGNKKIWKCNLTSLSEIESTVESIVATFLGIDVLVNCAGVLEQESIENVSEELWDQTIDVNLKGAFFMIQKSLPYLKKSNHPRIVNVSSNAGRMGGYLNGIAYASSKGGIIAMTFASARKLAPFGITVNCVAPGTIESEMMNSMSPDHLEFLKENFPLKRFGRPEEVASAVSYFASTQSNFTTGAILDVNGGLFMG